MKTISIISGDKRQFYIKEYLKNNGYNAEIITNMDFNNTDIIVAGTPFVKNNEYINCDYYTGFPVDTFLGLLKPKQIVFAGSISENIMKLFPKNIKLIDVLKDEDVVWSNAMLTAEGLIGEIIKNTDFIYELYKDNFNITSFDKKYMVSFMNRNDRKAEHLIITNY